MLKRGYKSLVEDALGRIHTLSVDEAQTKLGDPDVVFIDIREARELEREGAIPGAFNAPRGMLEFWVDPESPYHGGLRPRQALRSLLPVRLAIRACNGYFA